MSEDESQSPALRHPAVVAAVVTGVFAVLVALLTGVLNRTGSGSAPEVGAPSVPNSSTAASSQLPGRESSSPSSLSSPSRSAGAGGGLRNAGPLALKAGGIADLDSLEANWGGPGVARNVADLRVWDAGPNSQLDGGIPYTQFVEVPDDAPDTYETCSTATAYTHAIKGANLVKGLKFCVFTSERRYALLKVVDCSPTRGNNGIEAVRFEIAVWNEASP